MFQIFGKNRKNKHKAKEFLVLLIGIACLAAPLAIFPFPGNFETAIPLYARSYFVSPVSCEYSSRTGSIITLKFIANNLSQNTRPKYEIKEIPEYAKTVITFRDVSKINNEFDYKQVTANPLIDSMDYNIKNGDLVLEIVRKNTYYPAQVIEQGQLIKISLRSGGPDFPLIYNQRPADNASAFPSLHPISFNVKMTSPLKKATVFFQESPVDFLITPQDNNNYSFLFKETLEKDKEYAIKAIITDTQGRTTISSWSFIGQLPSEAALGKDRFKYLGWWGKINLESVNVRKNASSTAEKLGTLSSANRVKVLEEIYGEWIDGNNLWYKIDGGQYPGAYIYSDYITPIEQPAPPENYVIPQEVKHGDNWIDVDLTKKVMTLFAYDKPIFATYISPGREGNETQEGTFSVWYKIKKARMRGGPPLHSYRYDLKNIPWTMFYNHDYAIHGTYWHDKFGFQQSAGCTNMTQGDAKFIFDHTLPIIPDDKVATFAKDENPGTVVHNHY